MLINDQILSQQLPESYAVVDAPHLRDAGVLLLLLEEGGQDWVLFTRRSQSLRAHRGQISFPGGKRDPEDQNLQQTALRETHEEIGASEAHIEILGALPAFATQTGFFVYPFVGRLQWPIQLTPEPAEIDEIFRVPLKHLQDPRYYSHKIKVIEDQEYLVHYFQYETYTIWGITGHILKDFLAKL